MAVPLQLRALAALLAHQQQVHQGAPGGLGQAQDRAEREQARFAEKNRPKDLKEILEIAADHADAHDMMAVHINRIMSRLIASKYFYVEYENLALDWVKDQFKGRAAVQFRIVLKEAKRVATTTGIGQNSVLYRVLRDLLLAYPSHALKASNMQKNKEMLVWSPTKTAVETHAAWMTYYESYDRAVALTHNLDDVTLIVPAQDWATRFTEMQDVFPPWVMSLIINYPGRFTSMTTCWAAINAEALRQETGRKQSSARVFQLCDGAGMGDMEYVDDFPLNYKEAGPGAGLALCAMERAPAAGGKNAPQGNCKGV